MLQHVPEWLGHALRDVRAGIEKVAIADPALASLSFAGSAPIDLTSPPSRPAAGCPTGSPPTAPACRRR